MNLSPHVIIDTTQSALTDHFYPEEGYALYEDDETTNMDPETGEILCYWKHLACFKTETESRIPHIFAKLIEEGMDVYGLNNSNQ